MLLSMPVNSILDISPSPLKWHKDFSLGFNSLNTRLSVSCWGWEESNNFSRIFIPRVLTSWNISGTYLDYSSSEFEGGEASSSYQVTSDDRVLRWAEHGGNRGRVQGGVMGARWWRRRKEKRKLILTFVFPHIIYKKWQRVWKLLMLLGNCWQSHDFGKRGANY